MSDGTVLVHSSSLTPGKSGTLIDLPRQAAGWEWMSFRVQRLLPGDVLEAYTHQEEAAFVWLGGNGTCDWGKGKMTIGGRRNVFDGLPHTLYLPAGHKASIVAQSVCEIAECRVPSTAKLEPVLVTPSDVSSSLRGGGNVSRQIVDVISPSFPADKLVVIEVYTPGGNWSSYPPHKHDTHNPPTEVDLDEIYYFRIAEPKGFAFQHLYGGKQDQECTLKTVDGDVVLVRSGFHTVVAGPGYDTYYLNFLAGTSRELAVTDDMQHTWIRSSWGKPHPRLPLVRE